MGVDEKTSYLKNFKKEGEDLYEDNKNNENKPDDEDGSSSAVYHHGTHRASDGSDGSVEGGYPSCFNLQLQRSSSR